MTGRPSRFVRPELTDDTPITLEEACELYFRGIITAASLRAEHARGMLTIFRVGRQDFTTLRFVREMQERKCQLQNAASGSTKSAERGPSSTAEIESALVAARASFKALRASSRRRNPGS
ncbi:hypothetical protein [Bradyrhizobium genosp. A]|uniref:hypothetical protein n=1 Tax=Bradyrhizobium genosp. A TaxID=83626 RepID=UPI003CEC9071